MSDEEHDMPIDDLAEEPAYVPPVAVIPTANQARVPDPVDDDPDMPYIHIGDEAGDAGVAVAKCDRITVNI